MNNPLISICIPTYEAGGKGSKLLHYNLMSCLNQTYKNIEVIISDHSTNDEIKNLCLAVSDDRVKYIKNPNNIGSPAHNTNNAISQSRGSYIKIQNQDDLFIRDEVLEESANLLKEGAAWIVYTSTHYDVDVLHNTNNLVAVGSHRPSHPTDLVNLLRGVNTIGCPSCALFPVGYEFDTNVTYMIDCELYYSLYTTLGLPSIATQPSIGDGVGSHQLTHQLKEAYQKMMQHDVEYCFKKYDIK